MPRSTFRPAPTQTTPAQEVVADIAETQARPAPVDGRDVPAEPAKRAARRNPTVKKPERKLSETPQAEYARQPKLVAWSIEPDLLAKIKGIYRAQLADDTGIISFNAWYKAWLAQQVAQHEREHGSITPYDRPLRG